MTRFVAEAAIARPAVPVWVYAADIERHPEWMTVTDAQILRGHGGEIGARGRERMRFGPFAWDVEFEVVEAEPGRRIAWQSIGGAPFDLAVSLDLEPAGSASTKATYSADIQLHGVWRLLGPLVAMEGKAGPGRELGLLKAQLEGARAMAGVPTRRHLQAEQESSEPS
jgi:carbon monoxide dehydrogenase subunit G